MKYLYIKYEGTKRSTVMSDGTNVVLKLDTAPVVNTATVVNTAIEEPSVMSIHRNTRPVDKEGYYV